MNDVDDKLKAEALQWLVSLRGTAEKAQAFAIENAPDVLREMVSFGRVSATFWVVLGLLFFVLGVYWLYSITRIDWNRDENIVCANVVLRIILGVVFFAVGLIAFLDHMHAFMCAWFALRLYLIEQVSDLIGRIGHK